MNFESTNTFGFLTTFFGIMTYISYFQYNVCSKNVWMTVHCFDTSKNWEQNLLILTWKVLSDTLKNQGNNTHWFQSLNFLLHSLSICLSPKTESNTRKSFFLRPLTVNCLTSKGKLTMSKMGRNNTFQNDWQSLNVYIVYVALSTQWPKYKLVRGKKVYIQWIVISLKIYLP